MKINIQSVGYRSGTGVALEISTFSGNPPTNVTWNIVGETGNILETGQVTLTDADWNNWPAGDDSNYAEKIIASYIGLTPL